MRPTFLVLLAAFNGAKWIEEQVVSILAQENVNVSILISVDSSNDGTELLVDKLCNQDPRISILPHGMKFGGAAKNFFRLIKESPNINYDGIAFSDQDDIWLPRKLIDAFECMTQNNSDAYSSDVLAFWSDGRTEPVIKSQHQVAYDYYFEAAGPGCTYVFSSYLFQNIKTHISEQFATLDAVSLHDWYLYAYSRAHGYKWIIDSKANMLYRQHLNNQFGVNMGFPALRRRISSIYDGWYFKQAAFTATSIGKRQDPFVISWINLRRVDMFFLAFKGYKCRRRLREKIMFSFICLGLAVIGHR